MQHCIQKGIVQSTTVVLVVLMEDAIVHDDAHPFCADDECPCQVQKAWDALQAVPSYVEVQAAQLAHTPDEILLADELRKIYRG